jgi:tyrosyl-tRNA synthetase
MSDMTLSEELQWRGFINQSTFNNVNELDNQKWNFYHGFDASADSLTVGNLAGVMVDKVFMRHGCKAYILAGGATSLIGDPGGKDIERPLQDEATIEHNVSSCAKQLEKALAGYDFTLVNNLDWTKDMTVIEFLRDIGKYFSMTPLVQRDFIARRMGEGGSGISYTEFSYTLLQGMDFLHLFDTYGVTLQVGSSDQWGNCLSGVELIRRARNADAFTLTHPLVINKVTGKKFGKSEAGAVWLDPTKTSPTQFYQFWVNSDDEGVEGYLKVYTELGKPTVDEIMGQHRQSPKERVAQKRLAQEVTKLVHGEQNLAVAEAVTEALVGRRPVSDLQGEALEAIRREIPSVSAKPGDEVVETLVSSGLVSSKSEGRRLRASGGVYVNGEGTTKEILEQSDFQNGRLLIRKGKAFKDSALVELRK